jgi:smad nuclear-interacting protein 1
MTEAGFVYKSCICFRALARDERTGNTVNGVTLKWAEPPDAAKPELQWRLYVFKGSDLIETLHLHRQNSYLFVRDERVCDVLLAHPSCSKQHAVIQHRCVQRKVQKDDGDIEVTKVSLPYLLDLNSTHKTFLNNEAIEDSRYYELREKDVIRFGGSTREYVVMEGTQKEVM